ncbi:unnamed protein product, partial [Musa hybrid cultivar]
MSHEAAHSGYNIFRCDRQGIWKIAVAWVRRTAEWQSVDDGYSCFEQRWTSGHEQATCHVAAAAAYVTGGVIVLFSAKDPENPWSHEEEERGGGKLCRGHLFRSIYAAVAMAVEASDEGSGDLAFRFARSALSSGTTAPVPFGLWSTPRRHTTRQWVSRQFSASRRSVGHIKALGILLGKQLAVEVFFFCLSVAAAVDAAASTRLRAKRCSTIR